MNRCLCAISIVALVCAVASCLGQDPGTGPQTGEGTGTEKVTTDRWAEAERLRIERERPCTRARLRAIALRSAGRFREALDEAQQLEEMARQLNSPFQMQDGLELQGRILVDLGRYAEALPLLEEGTRTGGDPASKTDIALCRLRTGDLQGARAYDVLPEMIRWFGLSDASGLPGTGTSTLLEATLWLDRARGTDGDFLNSMWAIKAARICPTSVAANWLAAERLGCIGQHATQRKYLRRAAAGSAGRLQASATRRLGWRADNDWQDRFPQGTMPPPPGEGIAAVPDP